ncbi:unnamed protein product [Owenia fusiformis]|uniref:Uncharacterized protein n=1 Tax=Owenia fusiformis TaxID=6347 RepID=A0A8S4Q5X4_OWEFU|nr:unnamed protein product [Owenia fusiformis]
METLVGKWTVDSFKNIKELMQAMGLPADFQNQAESDTSESTGEIRKEGDYWCIVSGTSKGAKEILFQLNKEFDYKTTDGRDTKVTVYEEGSKVIEAQMNPVFNTRVTREIVDGKMVMEITEGKTSVTGTVVFKKM